MVYTHRGTGLGGTATLVSTIIIRSLGITYNCTHASMRELHVVRVIFTCRVRDLKQMKVLPVRGTHVYERVTTSYKTVLNGRLVTN